MTTPTDIEFEKLKQLFEYTKFHIGVYITLGTALMGLVGVSSKVNSVIVMHRRWLIAATVFIAIAGLAGGVLISSMCFASSITTFWDADLGPLGVKVMKARYWAHLEHGAFWLAFACAFATVAVKKRVRSRS